MIVSNEIIYDFYLCMYKCVFGVLGIVFRGNVMSLIIFDKIYLFSCIKILLLLGSFEIKKKLKKYFEIKNM